MKKQIIAGIVITLFILAGLFLGPTVVVLLSLIGIQVTMMKYALIVYLLTAIIFTLIGFKAGLWITNDKPWT